MTGHESASLPPPTEESRSFYWYFAERLICGKPVHGQAHAACVRDRGHGSEVACDGYYEPTVDERIALWRAHRTADESPAPKRARS